MFELALIFIFFVWHYSLFCGFVSDDHAVIEARKDIIPDAEKNPSKESYWVKVFNDGIVMYYLNVLLRCTPFRYSAFIWHSLCVGLHLVNCYLLYIFLSGIVGAQSALAVVVLWAINPMLNQNVTWVSGRPYLIGFMFGMICLLYHSNPIIFFPFYVLGVITNISIALIPILLKILYPSWQSNFYIAVMIVCGFPFILWKFKRRFTTSLVLDRENFKFKRRRFNALVKLFGYYALSFIYPYKMGWYHQSGFRYNVKWEKFNYTTLLSYVFLIFLARQGFAGWWFILGILPNANLFATNSFIQDRYIYFGSVGLFILIAPILWMRPELYFFILGIYAIRTWEYTTKMKNDETLYRENIRNHPKSDYAYNNLSYFLIQQNRHEEAKMIIFKGLEKDKENKMLWYNLGVCWAATGNLSSEEGRFRFLRAVECWKQALQLEPRWEKPKNDLKTLIEFLVKNKIITLDPNEAIPGSEMSLPVGGVSGTGNQEIKPEEIGTAAGS